MHSENAFSETPFGKRNNFVEKSRNWPGTGTRGFLRSLITIMMFKLTPGPPGAQEHRETSSPWNCPRVHAGKEKKAASGGFLGRWIQIWHRRTSPGHLVHQNLDLDVIPKNFLDNIDKNNPKIIGGVFFEALNHNSTSKTTLRTPGAPYPGLERLLRGTLPKF